jgi:hypothetical protein
MNDGLAQPIAPGDLEAPRHQVLEHLVHGVLVEQPPVDGLGLDTVRDVPLVIPFHRVPLVFFLL